MHMDPLTDFDWAAHWRTLVDTRDAEAPIDPDLDFWASVAPHLAYDPAAADDDPLLQLIERYRGPGKTAIDAGAGAGRHAVPLADRLEWVTAVEPSEGMRAVIPHRDNLTVVASSWEDAEVAPADFVVCAHVLYFIPDPVPFVEKLTRSARERVFVFMRDREIINPSEHLFEVLTGRPRTRMPRAYDAWNLVHALGHDPAFETISYVTEQVYDDVDAALAECRYRLGAVWDERKARQWLEANLQPRDDGRLSYGGVMPAAIVHWTP
jgi:methyltransferase family protein